MGNPKGQSNSTTTSGPPPEVMQNYSSLMNRANQVASTPYQAYTGNQVQGFSPDQLSAFQNVNYAQNAWQPFLNSAQQYATQGAAPISTQSIAQYQNPYQQSVINATMGNINETNQQQQANLVGQNLGGGGLFNDRLGVAQGELARQQGLASNQTFANLNSANYTQALGAAQADRSAAGQAAYTFGNLGAENLQNILTGAQAQLGTGGQQQQLGQAQLNVPYQQWQQQQAFPYQQTGWLAGIQTGVGSNMGGTSNTVATPAQPNPWATYGGLGLAGAGMFLKDGGRVGFDGGGAVAPFPYSGAMTYIPASQITRGSGAPKGAAPPGTPTNPMGDLTKQAEKLAGRFRPSGDDAPLDINTPDGGATQPATFGDMADIGSSPAVSGGLGALYAQGGPVERRRGGIYVPRGFADGGAPDFGSDFASFGQDGPPAGDFGAIDPGMMSPRSLGDMRPSLESGPTPPSAAPWGDMSAAPADAASFAQPSWAGAVGAAGMAPAAGRDFGSAVPASMTGDFGESAPPQRSWPDNAGSAGPGMAPPLEDRGTVGASGAPVPNGPISRVSVAGHGPASVRANNPGAQYPSADAQRFGMEGYDVIGGGHKIAVFPSPVNGAAANMDLFTRNYTGMTVGAAGAKWTGNNGFGVPGYDPKMVVTRDMMADPNFAIPFMKAIASREAGGPNPLSNEDWNKAHDMFMAGGAQGGAGTPKSLGDAGPMADRGGGARRFGDIETLPAGSSPASDIGDGRGGPHKGFGLGLVSPEMKTGLMKAGFALMSSRSPWLGPAIGDAAQAGMGAYTEATRHGEETGYRERKDVREDRKTELAQSKVDASLARLDNQHAQSVAALDARTKANELAARKQDEVERAHGVEETRKDALQKQALESGKIPPGYRAGKDGALEAIPGGPADPKQIAAATGAKRPPAAGMTPEQEEVQSNQVAQGNMSPLVGLPRTPEGLAIRNRLRTNAAQIIMRDHPDMTPSQVASHLNDQEQEFKSRAIGINARARTAGTREANIEIILREARSDVPTALEASQKVTRYGGALVPLNKLIQHGEVMSSNPEMVEFGMANLQLAEHWAKIMNPTGVMRESDRDLALKYLDTALSGGTYERAVHQLEKQMNKTYDAVRGMDSRSPVNPNAPAPSPGADADTPAEGTRKQFRQGWGIYRGGQWVPEAARP